MGVCLTGGVLVGVWEDLAKEGWAGDGLVGVRERRKEVDSGEDGGRAASCFSSFTIISSFFFISWAGGETRGVEDPASPFTSASPLSSFFSSFSVSFMPKKFLIPLLRFLPCKISRYIFFVPVARYCVVPSAGLCCGEIPSGRVQRRVPE